jgi:hypothetical protein
MYHAATAFQLAAIFRVLRQPGLAGIIRFIR